MCTTNNNGEFIRAKNITIPPKFAESGKSSRDRLLRIAFPTFSQKREVARGVSETWAWTTVRNPGSRKSRFLTFLRVTKLLQGNRFARVRDTGAALSSPATRSGPGTAPKRYGPIDCAFELQSWKKAAEGWI